MKRNCKGLWFPVELWELQGLSLVDKGLLIEIASLDTPEEHCFASNQYFAEFFHVAYSTISRSLLKLKNLGYIAVENAGSKKRRLFVKSKLSTELSTTVQELTRSKRPSNTVKLTEYLGQNDRVHLINNITNNITNNSCEAKAPQDSSDKILTKAKRIIDALNNLGGFHYKYTRANLSFIEARFKEGYTFDEIGLVMCAKIKEWSSDDRMKKYLRPATLFNREKFSQYYGQADLKYLKNKEDKCNINVETVEKS